MTKEIRNLRASLGRRLIPRANQLIVLGYAVKTLESKENKASKEITVTHNSVFAAHRLQCRMPIRKIAIRHFDFSIARHCTSSAFHGRDILSTVNISAIRCLAEAR